jgi:hypothetical protein
MRHPKPYKEYMCHTRYYLARILNKNSTRTPVSEDQTPEHSKIDEKQELTKPNKFFYTTKNNKPCYIFNEL